MVTDGQVRKLFRDLASERCLALAARRAGMDEKTARKYRSLGALPSTQEGPRTYRTRKDPLAELWQSVQARLEAEPRLLAKTLFDWLHREHPGQLTQSQRLELGSRNHLRVGVVTPREFMLVKSEGARSPA